MAKYVKNPVVIEAYQTAGKERYMDIEQKWREAQAIQQKWLEQERKRRHKPIPKAVRKQVYEKYNGHCAYCGRPIAYKDMQVDHIKAKYVGGAIDRNQRRTRR